MQSGKRPKFDSERSFQFGKTVISLFYRTRLLLLAACFATLCACTSTPIVDSAMSDRRLACQFIYDAGSSGTRLYLYIKEGGQWVEHIGPRTQALADPIRQIRGKIHADIDAVSSEVVAQLDRLTTTGPLDSKGTPEWSAFDWQARCRVTDVMVLATAGMRIAEQENAERSRELWAALNRKLQTRLGQQVKVTSRTLTGYEEGLFAWLAVRQKRSDNRFGIAEMGGASTQITFPCEGCSPADDAVRTVLVKGYPVRMFSYSFLGLGQDEAPKTLGLPATCANGVGQQLPGWKPRDCGDKIELATATGLRDPYNFSPSGQRGTSREIPTGAANVNDWVLTGAFNYLKPTAIANYCETAQARTVPPTLCFTAVYLDKYLNALSIANTSTKMDVAWTLGAALCSESQCLSRSTPPQCRWSPTGCLTQ